MSAQELASYLRNRIASLQISHVNVAQKAGVSRQTLYRLLNAEIESARLSTITQLANALNTSAILLLRIYYNAKPFSYLMPGTNSKYAAGIAGIFQVPLNETVEPNEIFDITWELVNIGNQAWENLRAVCIDNHLSDKVFIGNDTYLHQHNSCDITVMTEDIPIPFTLPGEHVRLTTTFRAPAYPCTLISHWKIMDVENRWIMPTPTGLFFMIQVAPHNT